MKAIVIIIFLIGITTLSYAQSAPPETVASKIAQKMKDSLGLNDTQKGQIYQINIQLQDAKIAKRQQHAGTDSVRIYLQRVENTRDSLYRPALTEEQYLLYLQKKKNIVNNN